MRDYELLLKMNNFISNLCTQIGQIISSSKVITKCRYINFARRGRLPAALARPLSFDQIGSQGPAIVVKVGRRGQPCHQDVLKSLTDNRQLEPI